jgi:hypothetical protein
LNGDPIATRVIAFADGLFMRNGAAAATFVAASMLAAIWDCPGSG